MSTDVDVLDRIYVEAQQSHLKYGSPTSMQESLGVLLEEFNELQEAIHVNDARAIEAEAIQVAAVAYRLAFAIASDNRQFMVRSGLK